MSWRYQDKKKAFDFSSVNTYRNARKSFKKCLKLWLKNQISTTAAHHRWLAFRELHLRNYLSGQYIMWPENVRYYHHRKKY